MLLNAMTFENPPPLPPGCPQTDTKKLSIVSIASLPWLPSEIIIFMSLSPYNNWTLQTIFFLILCFSKHSSLMLEERSIGYDKVIVWVDSAMLNWIHCWFKFLPVWVWLGWMAEIYGYACLFLREWFGISRRSSFIDLDNLAMQKLVLLKGRWLLLLENRIDGLSCGLMVMICWLRICSFCWLVILVAIISGYG